MTVRDCVSVTLKALAYSIDNVVPKGYEPKLNIVDKTNNFNRCYLGIDKNGFFIEEYKNFNGLFSDGKYVGLDAEEELEEARFPVTPSYVIRMFFANEAMYKAGEFETSLLEDNDNNIGFKPTYVMRYGIDCIKAMNLTDKDLIGCFGSYREIRNIISEIRESSNSGNMYPILLVRLKKEVNKIKINSFGISSKIAKISRMSYQEVATIGIHHIEIARIISVMAQVEDILIHAGRVLVANMLNYVEHERDTLIPRVTDEFINSLDLEEVLDSKVRWNLFCQTLGSENAKNLYMLENIYNSGILYDKLTDFGLECVPASYKIRR